MSKRLIHEKQGLPVPATKGLLVKSSTQTLRLTTEVLPLPSRLTRTGTWRFIWVLAAIVAVVIAVQANAINVKNCLIGLAAASTLMPFLRRLRSR